MDMVNTNKYLKVTFILFLCFILFDFIYINIRPQSETQSQPYFRGRNMKGVVNKFKCGYGKYTTSKKQLTVCKKRLPNCLIIGTAKAGTFALLKFLSAHPQVVRNEKINEYNFFSLHYGKGFGWYKDMMPYSLPGQIILDKSPSYFLNPDVPERVYRMNPNIHLILTVRHPIHRSVSAYAMNKEKFDKGRTRKQQESETKYESQTLGPFETRWKHYSQFYDVFFRKLVEILRCRSDTRC